MKRLISVFAILVLAGCAGGGGGYDFQVTTFQNGVNKGTSSVKTYQSEPTECSVLVNDGKLTWKAKLKNDLNTGKQGYVIGILTIHTNVNIIVFVDFGCSLSNGKEVEVGDTDKIVPDMPKGWQVAKDEKTGKPIVNCMIIPPAGCVTCTCAKPCGGTKCSGLPGNWPETQFFSNYRVEPLKPVMVERDFGPMTCKISNLLSVTADNKLISVSFDLTNEAKVDATFKIDVIATTEDGRQDIRPFVYTLLGGETKKDITCKLGFGKEFKSVTTNVSVNGKVKANKKTDKK